MRPEGASDPLLRRADVHQREVRSDRGDGLLDLTEQSGRLTRGPHMHADDADDPEAHPVEDQIAVEERPAPDAPGHVWRQLQHGY